MSTIAPIFKRPRNNADRSASSGPPSSDPFQPIPSSILNHQNTRQQSPATFLPVQIELSHFRPIAFRIFTKKYNLTLKSDALAVLAEFIGRKCGSEWRVLGEPILDEVARAWARAEGITPNYNLMIDSNPLVEGERLIPVLKTLEVPHIARSTSFILQSSQPNPSMYESQSGDTTPALHQTGAEIDPVQFFSVVDAFAQPKYVYNSVTKTFQLGSKPSIIAAPKEKATIFRERYHIILQRLLRNELFQSYPMHAAPKHQTAGKISSIKNLLGRRNQHFLLFGLLTRSPSGVLSLSDPDASITLDLKDAMSAGGIFAPGVFVLVDGKYTDTEKFRVHTMVLPPSERREISKQLYGHVDFLGSRETSMKGGIVPVEKEYEKFLVKAERAAGSVRMVFAGELNLDQPKVLTPLTFLTLDP
jgi:DNA polymerase epsilon subunit 2